MKTALLEAELAKYKFSHLGSDFCPRCGKKLERLRPRSMKWACLSGFVGIRDPKWVDGCNYVRK